MVGVRFGSVEYVYVFHVAAKAIVIQAISYKENIGHLKSYVVDRNITGVCFGLEQKRSELELRRLHLQYLGAKSFKSKTCIHYIFEHHNGPVLQVLAKTDELLHLT